MPDQHSEHDASDDRPTVADEAGLDPDNDGAVDNPSPTADTPGGAAPDDGEQEAALEDVEPADRDAQGPSEPTREQRAAQMPDELKVDIDQDKMQAWDDVRGEYGIKEGAERPIMVGEGEAAPMASDEVSEQSGADSSADPSSNDSSSAEEPGQQRSAGHEAHHTPRPDHETRSSAEPTDGQPT